MVAWTGLECSRVAWGVGSVCWARFMGGMEWDGLGWVVFGWVGLDE